MKMELWIEQKRRSLKITKDLIKKHNGDEVAAFREWLNTACNMI